MALQRILRTTAPGAGLLGVLIILAFAGESTVTAGGGGCHGEYAAEATGTQVQLRNNCFSPTVLNVEPGDTVVFENFDFAKHDVAGVAGLWGTGTGLLGEGASASVTFSEPGLYPYSCYLHYGMTGVISVGDDRKVAGKGAESLVVTRAPLAPSSAPDEPAAAAQPRAEGGLGDMRLAWGGLLAGVAIVAGAWTFQKRRSS